MEKIVVPEGMLEAFLKGRGHQAYGNFRGEYRRGLEAALEWLAVNPIIPTDEQITDFYGYESEAGVSYQFLQRFAKWFQVRMFLAHKPDVDPVKDLLFKCDGYPLTAVQLNELVNARLIEAYRRGRESK